MEAIDWNQCLRALEAELTERQFNTWVRPLHAVELPGALKLLAPNRFAVEWARANLLPRLDVLLADGAAANAPAVSVEIGSRSAVTATSNDERAEFNAAVGSSRLVIGSGLQDAFNFDSFVGGPSNELAKAAAIQVAQNPGHAYNPLLIYGGVGLGKTHLLHAIAHVMKERKSRARIAYVHSERFVSDMVSALQRNTINDFKAAYRSLDVLLVDDIQFFGGKKRSQEEFFHTFNELFEGGVRSS